MVGCVIDYISTRLQSGALIWLASETTGAWPVYTKIAKRLLHSNGMAQNFGGIHYFGWICFLCFFLGYKNTSPQMECFLKVRRCDVVVMMMSRYLILHDMICAQNNKMCQGISTCVPWSKLV